METVKGPMVARGRMDQGGMNMWSTEDFFGSEINLHDTIMLDTCYYISVQIY